VAASLSRNPRLEVETVEGRYGEFTVLADGEEIIRGGPLGFVGVLPSVRSVRDLVERRLELAAEEERRPGPGACRGVRGAKPHGKD
jgi:hypothetical protein